MKSHACAVVVALSALAAGCDGDRAEQLQERVSRLEAQLEATRSKQARLQEVRLTLDDAKADLGALSAAVDKLKSTALMIGYVDKRVAVLGIQAAADEIEGAAIEIESTIDAAIRAAR